MISKVTEIQDSRIFQDLWKKYGENLNGGDEEVTMEMIFSELWSRICEELQEICRQFRDGDVKLKKIEEYLDMFKMDYDAVVDELVLLSRYFNGAGQLNKRKLDQIKNKLAGIMEKVKSCKKLFNARQAAEAILNLQDVMGLTGDFSQVKSIEKVWQCIYILCKTCVHSSAIRIC
jgi:archaellum component FlaC